MFSLIAALGPMPRQGSSDDSESVQLVFSGNWAAVVGVVICVALLFLWAQRNDINLKSGKKDWE